MTAVIIDDEPKARLLLSTILKDDCPDIKQQYEAEDLLQGIRLIKKYKPELVFLDIEMPEHSGLELLDFLSPEDISFDLIFTTAYNEYALKAFQLSAISYLLKPLRPQQVIEVVQRVKSKLHTTQVSKKLEQLKENLNSQQFSKIGLTHAKGITFVKINDIILFEASGMYTSVLLKNEEIVVSKPLKYYVELLKDQPLFFRSHRSFLINLNFLKEFIRVDGGYLLMENNKRVSIAKDNVDSFLKAIQERF
ncbi:LytTR family DNA-binding domain-containing protein [Gangjinia marincola]|uniref:LytTR family DNA-binding domain-containing protein n=1 Tax=Gangjinia marincola TaxID=578463 RepID=A0ABN1MIQ9_9FLAO